MLFLLCVRQAVGTSTHLLFVCVHVCLLGACTQHWYSPGLGTWCSSSLTTAGLLDSAALNAYHQNLPLFRTLTYGPWSTNLTILHLVKLRQKTETQSSSPRRPMADHLWFWPARKVRVNTQKVMIKTEHLWAEDTVDEEEWTRTTASQLN